MESSERLIVHQDQDGSLETKESCHLRGRQRHQQKQPKEEVRFVPRRHSTPVTSHWNHSSTFDGRLFLSRLIKNGSPADYGCIGILIVLLGLCLVALYFCYFHFQWFHFHVTHAYAHIGHIEAQHLMGDKYLHGQGIDKDENMAMHWYRQAAAQGHPHSSYNLAIGHLNGLKTNLGPGEAHKLIQHAADQGVKLAKDVLHNVCKHGRCE